MWITSLPSLLVPLGSCSWEEKVERGNSSVRTRDGSAKVWDIFMFLCPKSSAFWCQTYFCTGHLLGDLGTKPEQSITWETELGWGSATPDSRTQEKGFSSKLPVAKAMPPSQACCPGVVWWYLMLQLQLDRAWVSCDTLASLTLQLSLVWVHQGQRRTKPYNT